MTNYIKYRDLLRDKKVIYKITFFTSCIIKMYSVKGKYEKDS